MVYTQDLKAQRKRQVLAWIRARDGQIDAASLANMLTDEHIFEGITRATLSTYVMELIEEGLIYAGEDGVVKVTPELGPRIRREAIR